MLELHELGFNDSLQHAYAALPPSDRALQPARVTAADRGILTIATALGDFRAEPSGRLLHHAAEGELPAVGDWVRAELRPGEARATIHDLLPRTTVLRRGAAGGGSAAQVLAANVDVALVVQPVDRVSLNRLERTLALVRSGAIQAVALLSKSDLVTSDQAAAALEAVRSACPGLDVLALSAVSGAGIGDLERWLEPRRTLALIGPSGAGKSSLVNRLAGAEVLTTGGLDDLGRGRHTTTRRQIVRLAGGALLLDTPGLREMALVADAEVEGDAFERVHELAQGCRFRDCRHRGEPGCAVESACESGAIERRQLESLHKLEAEQARLRARHDRALQASEKRRLKTRARGHRLRDRLERG